MRYNFVWDPVKASRNLRKHRVSFERAATVFRDPNHIAVPDDEHSDQEERWMTLGFDQTGVLLVVVHTFRQVQSNEALIRLISARRATHGESRQYQDRNNEE